MADYTDGPPKGFRAMKNDGVVLLREWISEQPTFLGVSEPLESGASAVDVALDVYETKITSGGTAGSEDVNIGDGTGITVGQVKLITFESQTDPSDVLNLDHANIVNANGEQCTNVDLENEDDWLLLRWNGSAWQIIDYADTATIAPVAQGSKGTETVTTGASPVAANLEYQESSITTGGTAGSEDFNIGDGTGVKVGTKHLITLAVRTDGSDVVNIDHANWVDFDNSTGLTNLDLDAAGEYVLGEWNGTKWRLLYTNGTKA